jgi:hypothetical protein
LATFRDLRETASNPVPATIQSPVTRAFFFAKSDAVAIRIFFGDADLETALGI